MADSFFAGLIGVFLVYFGFIVFVFSVASLFGATAFSFFLQENLASLAGLVQGFALGGLLLSIAALLVGARLLVTNENAIFNGLLGLVGLFLVIFSAVTIVTSGLTTILIAGPVLIFGLGLFGHGFGISQTEALSEPIVNAIQLIPIPGAD